MTSRGDWIAPIGAGLVLALFAQATAFMMVGAGHGWISPFFVSPLLFVAMPVALIRVSDFTRLAIGVELLLLIAAIAADAWLICATLGEYSYFEHILARYPGIAWPWILIWAGWQVAAAASLAIRLRERRRERLGTRTL
ncbi:MAG: hypothetical protein V4574_02740 [Pseudomonadota bacterium]